VLHFQSDLQFNLCPVCDMKTEACPSRCIYAMPLMFLETKHPELYKNSSQTQPCV